MKDVNKIILVGRLGGDPIQRQTKAGTSVVQFSVATTRKYFREDPASRGTKTFLPAEETQWHKVVSWGKLGEVCATFLKKGNSVYVEGSLRSHHYSDRNGHEKLSFEVHAEDVSFLSLPQPSLASGPSLFRKTLEESEDVELLEA